MEDAARPLPKLETTPPVTKMYLVIFPFQVLGFQVSGFKFQVSSFRFQVSGFSSFAPAPNLKLET
jgi:hypothetical protein